MTWFLIISIYINADLAKSDQAKPKNQSLIVNKHTNEIGETYCKQIPDSGGQWLLKTYS